MAVSDPTGGDSPLTNPDPVSTVQGVIAGAAGAAPATASSQTGLSLKALLDYGMTLLGTPYRWGGKSVNDGGLDCSGLVSVVYSHFGVQVPQGSINQAAAGSSVTASQAQAGDLIAFRTSNGQVGHIGIYLGGGKMLVAPHTGAVVRIEKVNLTASNVATIRRVAPNANTAGLTKTASGLFFYPPPPNVAVKGSSVNAALSSGGDVNSTSASLSIDDLAAQYGFVASFFKQSPELQSLIGKAVKEQWTPEKFGLELQKTSWFKHHSDAQREWAKLTTADPAGANRQRAIRRAEIARIARETGVKIDPKRLDQMVEQSLANGFSDIQLTDMIGHEFHYKPKSDLSGKAGDYQDSFAALAADYAVPIAKDTIGGWVQKIVNGKATEQDFDNYVKTLAKSRFPGLAAQIDQGITVRDYAEPYRALMSQTLEIDPASVDFTKDRWITQALDFRDGKGQVGVMPLWQFQQAIKDDPRWLATNNARDSVLGGAHKVLQDMGLRY